MSSWQIDSATGDYVMENGKPVSTEDLGVPAYYRIKIRRKGWMYAPNDQYGSDLNTLKKKSGNAALGMIENACQPIVEDGRALAVDAGFDTTAEVNRNNAAVNVTLTSSNGAPQVLNLPPIGV